VAGAGEGLGLPDQLEVARQRQDDPPHAIERRAASLRRRAVGITEPTLYAYVEEAEEKADAG
jgi:hypothetical protein